MILQTVKKKLGLENCKFSFTGAAPISTETLKYFGALGIQINEARLAYDTLYMIDYDMLYAIRC